MIAGIDVSGIEVEGVYTTMLRLEEAVRTGNSKEMERLVDSLDNDIRRLSMSRGLLGPGSKASRQCKRARKTNKFS